MILSKNLASATREICENLYKESISKVYDYCNKIGLDYSNCKPCEVETPTIKTHSTKECAICGKSK